jgi:endoglucanase
MLIARILRSPACLVSLLLSASTTFGQNPGKLPSSARVDLMATPAVGSITNGTVLQGGGSIQRMNWIATADQPRSYTCDFPIIHFSWKQFEIQFTPENSGGVDLTLMGPWEQSTATGTPIYRQEVLWDNLSATNTTVANPSFETISGTLPTSWTRPYGDGIVVSDPTLALAGIRFVRTWHDGQLRQRINVTAGQPVTLRFYARAHPPAGFIDNARILSDNTPAHVARLKFMRGVNLGNYLEAPAGQNWGQTYNPTDFANIRAEGFDHVRIPARWNDYTGPAPNFTISESFVQKVDALINGALAQGLGAIVNIHHFDAFTTNPAAETNKFYKIWEQIAARYANRTNTLAFELLNEPKDAATTEILNPIYAEAIRRIRVTNPDRTIFVGPGNFNSISQLTALRLPASDTNLIVTVHSYEPFLFTHQGATWTGSATATTGIIYPGPPQTPLTPASNEPWVVDWIQRYNTTPIGQNPSGVAAFGDSLQLASVWSQYYGRPVHVGEFGAYELADANSRARFYHDMRYSMDVLGLGWATWDWKTGFKYWDSALDAPAPGLRESFFPRLNFFILRPGFLATEVAQGKRIRILRRTDLSAPWQPIFDQVNTNRTIEFEDPTAPANHSFYLLEWLK